MPPNKLLEEPARAEEMSVQDLLLVESGFYFYIQ